MSIQSYIPFLERLWALGSKIAPSSKEAQKEPEPLPESAQIAALKEQLEAAEKRADDWQRRYREIDARRPNPSVTVVRLDPAQLAALEAACGTRTDGRDAIEVAHRLGQQHVLWHLRNGWGVQ